MKNYKNILINAFRSLLVVILVITLVGCKGKTTESTKATEDTTPRELNTNLTDNLKLDLDYEGKIFQVDKIGEVDLVSCVDGDTIEVKSNNENIRVRFHVVDTPETKGQLDPWGKPASDFTCAKLTNATTIVLEGRETLMDTYGRYLAYVWYDGRLLNLELVEQAYSGAGETSDPRYGSLFAQAETYARSTKKRIYGEQDPTYDYDRKSNEITLEELRTNTTDYMGLNVLVEGVVTRKIGYSAFIESNGYGIYIYTQNSISDLKVGNIVEVEGTVADYYNQIQLTGVTRLTVDVISQDNPVVPRDITISDVKKSLEGTLVKISDLEITKLEPSGEAYNIYVKDQNNQNIMLRLDKKVMSKFDMTQYQVGDFVDATVLVAQFHENFQLMLCGPEDLIVKQ